MPSTFVILSISSGEWRATEKHFILCSSISYSAVVYLTFLPMDPHYSVYVRMFEMLGNIMRQHQETPIERRRRDVERRGTVAPVVGVSRRFRGKKWSIRTSWVDGGGGRGQGW